MVRIFIMGCGVGVRDGYSQYVLVDEDATMAADMTQLRATGPMIVPHHRFVFLFFRYQCAYTEFWGARPNPTEVMGLACMEASESEGYEAMCGAPQKIPRLKYLTLCINMI